MGAAQPHSKEQFERVDEPPRSSRPGHNLPQLFLYRPKAGIPVSAFGNRTQRDQQRKEFEKHRLMERALILGSMFLFCLLVGVIAYMHFGGQAAAPAPTRASENESGAASHDTYPVLDQDTQIQ